MDKTTEPLDTTIIKLRATTKIIVIFTLILFNACSGIQKSEQEIQQTHLLAVDYYKNHNDSQAIKLWQEVVKYKPTHVEAWQNIAVVQQQSDINAAIKTLEDAVDANPNDAGLNSHLAKLLQQTGKTRKSDELIDKTIKNNPNDANAYNTKALNCFSSGDYKCSVDNLLKVKKIDPKFNGINFNLGLAYEKLRQFQLAADYFKTETELSPLNSDALAKLADCYNALGQNDLAIEYYKKAIKIDPKITWPHYNLAVLTEAKDQKAAVKYYNDYLKLVPNDPHAWSNLGLINLEHKKTAQALSMLKNAVKYGNNQPHFHYNLGLAWNQMNCSFNAYQEYQTALAGNPNLSPAKNALVRLATKNNFQLSSNSELNPADIKKMQSSESKSCK